VAVRFGHPASWAFGLGVLGGAIAGTVVPAATPAEELRHVVGFIFLFGPTIYVLIERREHYWEAKHPYMRFVVYTLSLVVATVVLVRLAVFLPLGDGSVARTAEFLAALAGFGVTVWATFLGGAELIWERFLERTDTEW